MLPIREAQDRPLLLVMEGLIGSGKSTAALSISEVMGIVPIMEPVATNPYLDDFYKAVTNQPGSLVPAFMQLHLLTKRFHLYQAALHGMPIAKMLGHPAKGAIMDRSLIGDTVFARMNADSGAIKPREFESYFSHWQTMQNFLPYPHAMIYLEVEPKEAFKRACERARDEEMGRLSLGYMNALQDSYEEMIKWAESRMKVIRIDWNYPRSVYHLSEAKEWYPTLVSMYQGRGVPEKSWPNVLPLSEAEHLVDKMRQAMPERGFWDRMAAMAID